MRKVLSLFYFCTEIITFPLKGRLSSFIVSGKFPYRVKFYTKPKALSSVQAAIMFRWKAISISAAAWIMPVPMQMSASV